MGLRYLLFGAVVRQNGFDRVERICRTTMRASCRIAKRWIDARDIRLDLTGLFEPRLGNVAARGHVAQDCAGLARKHPNRISSLCTDMSALTRGLHKFGSPVMRALRT